MPILSYPCSNNAIPKLWFTAASRFSGRTDRTPRMDTVLDVRPSMAYSDKNFKKLRDMLNSYRCLNVRMQMSVITVKVLCIALFPKIWKIRNTWCVYHEKRSPQAVWHVTEYWAKRDMVILYQTPHSPMLALPNFLFPSIKAIIAKLKKKSL